MEFSSICIMRIINLIKFHSHNFSSIETSVLIHFELLEELNRSSPTLSFHSLWISKWIQKMLTPENGPSILPLYFYNPDHHYFTAISLS